MGGPRFQEGTRSAKDKLERYSQERSARNGTYLGSGGGGSSQQTRMASECGRIRSRGHGMNQVKSSLYHDRPICNSKSLQPRFTDMSACNGEAQLALKKLHDGSRLERGSLQMTSSA